MRRFLLLAVLLLGCPPMPAEAADDAAPDDAWPMARGCPAGTGRSATTLRLPLAERWHRGFEKTAFGAVPTIADGTIYLGDLDGTFHALDLATGATRWTFKAEAAGFPSAAAVSLDPALPLVAVGDDTGVVRMFDRTTGKVAWEYETEGEISGGPTILAASGAGPKQARVLVGSQDASLSCLELADGKLLWKHSIADQIRCSPTVARTAEGDRVFLAGCDGKLHVIDAENGEEKAAVPIGGPTGTTPATAGTRVFFGTEGGGFFAIDFLEARVAWQTPAAANAQSYRSSAAIAGDLVVVGSRGKAVEAFSSVDGSRKWRHPLRGRVDASPVVASAADGRPVSVVADGAGKILALDAATGETVWEFDAGGGFSAGAAVASGHVVIASDDGTVWCFSSADR
ncbi:MAG: PQQ-binding-like beta-propeller repeat protein [Planctomycetia bacterium]